MPDADTWPPRPGYYAEDACAHLTDEADLPALDPAAVALRQRAAALAQLETAAAIDRLKIVIADQHGP